MKKLLFSIFALLIINNVAFSQRYTSKDFISVGIEHNIMLNVAYETILNKKLNNDNKSEIIPFLKDSFLENKNLTDSEKEAGLIFLNNLGKEMPNIDQNFYSFSNSSQISKNALPYYDKLYSIVMSEGLSVEDFNISIQKLESEIYNDKNIDNKQLLIFYSGTNVAKYTNLYWEENFIKWEQLNSTNNTLSRKGRGRRVVGADVGGAIGGAVTCWMMNAVPGAGQVGYGGAIACGAVGASIGEAVNQLMDWAGW